ncbi:diacylglycerol O-acyltransferase [Microlunatus endophyticus]|uniref:Diacylglycerol O-acyltransferase n=1 Tax=Microlunatus endophyticus TaxID=1716077 RepID=A0A917S9Y5_9ACTN|nr:wax ester/triacylglycerol synthase family O-acyltransferase [Microlunatus endophyticus]GGL66544.1 diacylglycerol O-acyltransferase [Microlunatus endophyticus]
MPDRLTALEQTTLALDTARTPATVGTVDIFAPGPDGFDYERLIGLIRDRIRYVPRYRQRILGVPGRLADPVWVDDNDFDLTFHVRRSALPRPGNRQQLREFAGRVLSRRIDRTRPLWELYFVEGLEDDGFALVGKTHQALVNGLDTVDLIQVLLDNSPDEPVDPQDNWHPLPEPSAIELVAGAVTEGLRDPTRTLANFQHALTDAVGVAVAVSEAVGFSGALSDLAADALRGTRIPGRTPLAGMVSEQRRVAVISADLDDLRAVRTEHDHTINDVVLAMITGGLRSWLMTRGETIGPASSVTALVPMSALEDPDSPEASSLGSRVVPHLMRLPVGEANASIRLHQIGYGTQAHKDSGQAIGARTISDIAGFAPVTLHDLGVRTAGEPTRRPYDLLITNAPGPQAPVYLGSAPLVASYPIIPLSSGHLLAIGATSYNGRIFIGLNADRDAFRDLDVLAQCMTDALEELLDTTVRARAHRPPTRAATAEAKARVQARKESAAKKSAAKKAAAKKAAAKKATATKTTKKTAATKAAAKKRTAPDTDEPGETTS